MTLTDPIPTLFDPGPSDHMTLAERFDAFHRANPWVLERLASMSRSLVARGHKRIGVAMLFEVLRWEWATSTDDPTSDWKLNNSYRSFYVRRLVADYPELAGLFEMRRSQADGAATR